MFREILVVLATICYTATALCPGDTACSGHGTCGSWDRCSCYANWQGYDCSKRTCPFNKAWADIKDSSAHASRGEHYYAECGGKGICDRSTGKCSCFAGFTGKGCKRMTCPNDCSGHGTCDLMSRANSGYTGWDAEMVQVCTCDPGWTGPSCNSRKCKTGDDPLTLNAVGGNTIQENEVQELRFTDSGNNSMTGTFALTYQDWRGEQWTTWAIDIATATAITIKEALAGLPNLAIPSVSVTKSGTGAATGSVTFTVTFDDEATPGNQPALIIENTACTTAGCQPVLASVTSSGTTTAEVVTTTSGSEENAECSRRGFCNEETGLCTCYKGYYGEACQMQTIIT